MHDLWQGLTQAVYLLTHFDPAVWQITVLSLSVSGIAVVLAAIFGIPLGVVLGLKPFRGRALLVNLIYTLMGLPPVLAGLVVYLILSHRGPLGTLELLFTPTAMVIVQVCLALPIITGLTLVGVMGKDRLIRDTAVSLGASDRQVVWTMVREARLAIIGAVITGFGRLIGEVGAVILVGGNIEGSTRVLTTAIILETRMGNYDRALALGIVLLLISFTVNWGLHLWQQGVKDW